MKNSQRVPKKSKQPVKVNRVRHDKEDKDKATRYYIMGLTLPEISLLLNNTPVRTLEKWQSLYKWTELKTPTNIKDKVLQLHESGKRLEDIAEIVNKSVSTVYRWIKSAREKEGTETE